MAEAVRGESIAFDRAAEYYDRTRGYPEGVAERVANLLCQAGRLGPHSRVLEVGVGTGRIAVPLSARVRSLVGVDVARPMLKQLLRKPGSERVRPVIADATALPLPPSSCDAVVGVHVFHLLPAWRRALAEVARVLRPGGCLLAGADSWLLRELWDEAYRDVPRLDNVGVQHGSDDFATEAGFRAAGVRVLRYPLRVSLATFQQEIEDRVWSATWRLDDGAHRRLCANMRAAIVARYGLVDVTVELEREFTLRVFEPA